MHLLSKNQTIAKALVYGLVSAALVIFLIQTINEGDALGIFVNALLVAIYISIWRDYVKAFKRRAYDREYAKIKEQLQQTLSELLPTTGMMTLTEEGKFTFVRRSTLRFFKKDLFRVVAGSVEVLRDDMAMSQLMVTYHSYTVIPGTLYVAKSFDTMLPKEDDAADQEVSVPSKSGLLTSVKDAVNAERDIPEDLRYASPQELIDLHNSLREWREEIVS